MEKATLISLTAVPGHANELQSFLKVGGDLVGKTEPGTQFWSALVNEKDQGSTAIFDTFADQSGRDAHFSGQVAAALHDKAASLVEGGWEQGVLNHVQNFHILYKLVRSTVQPLTKANVIPLKAAPGKAEELAAFLKVGGDLVNQTEPNTMQWYALQSETDPNSFAIVDMFANEQGRAAHFAGNVAAALQEKSAELVQGGWEQGVLATALFYDLAATCFPKAR
jgi:quinol monooxygenase YgiN